jgi:hypothetical protein
MWGARAGFGPVAQNRNEGQVTFKEFCVGNKVWQGKISLQNLHNVLEQKQFKYKSFSFKTIKNFDMILLRRVSAGCPEIKKVELKF